MMFESDDIYQEFKQSGRNSETCPNSNNIGSLIPTNFMISLPNGTFIIVPSDLEKLTEVIDAMPGKILLPKHYGQSHCEFIIKVIKNIYMSENKRCTHEQVLMSGEIYNRAPAEIIISLQDRCVSVSKQWDECDPEVELFKRMLCFDGALLISHYCRIHVTKAIERKLHNILEFVWGCIRGLNQHHSILAVNLQFAISKTLGCIGITNMTRRVNIHINHSTQAFEQTDNEMNEIGEPIVCKYYVYCKNCKGKYAVEIGSELEQRVKASLKTKKPYRLDVMTCNGRECSNKRESILKTKTLYPLKYTGNVTQEEVEVKNKMNDFYTLFGTRSILDGDKGLVDVVIGLENQKESWSSVVTKGVQAS